MLKAMVILRHLVGSDPSIEIADEQPGNNAALTLHFEARPPRAALSIRQDTRSVVISDAQRGSTAIISDLSDVTQVTRTKGSARWLTSRHWVILLESNWVVVVVGLSVLVLLICAIKLRQN